MNLLVALIFTAFLPVIPPTKPHLVSAEITEGTGPIERAVEWLSAHHMKCKDDHQLIAVPVAEVRAGDLIEFDPGDKPIEWGIVFSNSSSDHLGVDIGDSQISVFVRVERDQIKTVLRSVHVTPVI
jgi:hypothetical protein